MTSSPPAAFSTSSVGAVQPADAALPVVALVQGDPFGIGPELTAASLRDRTIRGVCQLLWVRTAAEDTLPTSDQAAGQAALRSFEKALDMAARGEVSAVCFAPFTKHSMKLADPGYVDEIEFMAARYPAVHPPVEFNVLDEFWTARVTSHIALRDVPAALTAARIVERLVVVDRALKAVGKARPKIAVAALNPHAGDGGNFGDEEASIIAPAIAQAQAMGVVCDGPHPADTVFIRARRERCDAVLTMYHDQGQIAMKLLGFERGVVLFGGFGFPIATPAHGSARDIAGQGVADTGAMLAAVRLAAQLSRQWHGGAS